MKQRNPIRRTALLAGLVIAMSVAFHSRAQSAPTTVGRYRVFETSIKNDQPYANKFKDVNLTVTYQAPSGSKVEFWGFFDGDGQGGGDLKTGNVWKLRFMPNELGAWKYEYRWSDGTPGGQGTFDCIAEGAGKGVLQAYKENPYWFAYNGTEPVWIKSYYETGHGMIAQPFDWIVENVLNRFVEHKYNHLQINWLLSLCCFRQYYLDGPPPETLDLEVYTNNEPSRTMNLAVWKMMERPLGWLNDRNIGVHMFLGFNGSKNGGPAWPRLTAEEKEFYVRYTISRAAPYANVAGWNYVWEVQGYDEEGELGLARLIQKYDVFNHLRTYQDEMPRENEFHMPEYTFAAVENHRIVSPDKQHELPYRKDPWTHHMACLMGFRDKPVYMSEGNALWRRYWMERSGATQDDLRRSAWGCATAGASFCWNGHASEYELYSTGPTGLPFHDESPFKPSVVAMDVLADVMNNDVVFYKLRPNDNLLSHHDPMRVWALAEPGSQYLVFASQGEPFALKVAKGDYPDNVWIDAKNGNKTKTPSIAGKDETVSFAPPDRATDWVLVLRAKSE